MIVVGGWPNRKIVGLNGRFGVRPAGFATGAPDPSPFANDVDGSDSTTEFVGIVQTLPASGTVTFEDDGNFVHAGAADGSYTTTFTLVTWAQGGPVTVHAPDETVSTTIGASGTPTGLATETETALALPAVQRLGAGIATESESALALAAVQSMLVGLALEVEQALALVPGGTHSAPVGLAIETEVALALSALGAVPAIIPPGRTATARARSTEVAAPIRLS